MLKVFLFLAAFCFAATAYGQASGERSFREKLLPEQGSGAIIQDLDPERGEAVFWRRERCPFTGRITYTRVIFSEAEKRYVPAGSGNCRLPADQKKYDDSHSGLQLSNWAPANGLRQVIDRP